MNRVARHPNPAIAVRRAEHQMAVPLVHHSNRLFKVSGVPQRPLENAFGISVVHLFGNSE